MTTMTAQPARIVYTREIVGRVTCAPWELRVDTFGRHSVQLWASNGAGVRVAKTLTLLVMDQEETILSACFELLRTAEQCVANTRVRRAFKYRGRRYYPG